MSAFPLTVLLDPTKVEDVFEKLDNKKKLEMLMDPRVIEISKKSPQCRQVLAEIVRKLQYEREMKRGLRSREKKEDLTVPRWFDCINFMKTFSAAPKQSEPRSSDLLHKQRNKLTVSTPNLETLSLPDVPPSEGPTQLSKKQLAIRLPEVNRDSVLQMNLLQYCNSDKEKKMIFSLLNNAELKKILGFKSVPFAQRESLVRYLEPNNCSDKKCLQYQRIPITYGQAMQVLQCNGVNKNLWYRSGAEDGSIESFRNNVTSATQTILSGSCSLCSNNCVSIDSYRNYNKSKRNFTFDSQYKKVIEVAERFVRGNRRNFMYDNLESDIRGNAKTSKSLSAIYTTEYSECDCGDFCCDDEVSSGKYLSRILNNAEPPSANYLTTPDVLVSYSDGQHSSDSETSSSSCEACRQLAHISSESFHCEPDEVWTQKRSKTSCETCSTSFRSKFIKKSKYCSKIPKFSHRTESYTSLSDSDASSETSPVRRRVRKDFRATYIPNQKSINNERSIVDIASPHSESSYCVNNKPTVITEKLVDVSEIATILSQTQITNTSSYESNEKETSVSLIRAVAKKPEITASESSFMFAKKLQSHSKITSNKVEKTESLAVDSVSSGNLQKDGAPCRLSDKALSLEDNTKIKAGQSGESFSDRSNFSLPRGRRQRKIPRNASLSDTVSDSSICHNGTFPRRFKSKLNPNQTPPQNHPQKATKQKSRHKNCAIM